MRFYNNFEYDHPLIRVKPAEDLQIIAVTPALNEKKLFHTIESLYQAEKPDHGSVEMIVVLNASENVRKEVSAFHKDQMDQLLAWAKSNNDDTFALHPILITGISEKYAGVGFARKVGMDEAMHRFLSLGYQEGIITCPDADVTVASNYFKALKAGFEANPGMQAASIQFEHDLEIAALNGLKDKIIQYESHLRYMIRMQRLIGLPFAYQTVGSSMAVNVKGYMEQFGMNKRKAGEDFYFLHKFINAGYLFEINDTTVYPEARYSDRVPFGTGRTMNMGSDEGLTTYHYKTFETLASLTINLENIYLLPETLEDVLEEPVKRFFGDRLLKEIEVIKAQTRDFPMFQKRFYRWFDAFQLIKYQHFCRDHYFEDIPVEEACKFLFNKLSFQHSDSLKEMLFLMRSLDREGYKKKEAKAPFNHLSTSEMP